MFQNPLHLQKTLLIWLSRLSLFTKFLDSVTSVINTFVNNINKALLSIGFVVINLLIDEIIAFIGLQFISGANNMGFQALPDLFTSLQLPHFRAAISRDRLNSVFKFCTFDDSVTREWRKVQDKFWHIRELWDKLISGVRKLYNLDPYGAIDEMLLKFSGRCRFRQTVNVEQTSKMPQKVLDFHRCSKSLLLQCYAVFWQVWGQISH